MNEIVEIADLLSDSNEDEMEDALVIEILGNPQRPRRLRVERYGLFRLENQTDENVRFYFRLDIEHIVQLVNLLRMPQQIRTADRHFTSGIVKKYYRTLYMSSTMVISE
ncbi:hypothetical protein FQR65_LT15050 [Abscondita terminalis]|nr:hypothetical protein FQR65_LT15050 [Abscondita terminalis]